MQVDPSAALRVEHRGETFYFCSERCRRTFGARLAEEEVEERRSVARAVLHALSSFTASEIGTKATALLAMLLVLMLTINGLNVLNSYVGRDFISALENKDMPEFMRQSGYYFLVFVCSSVAAVFYRYAEETLGLVWRESQTRQWLERYLADGVYYRLTAAGEIENPDQRISEDVRAFTTTSLSFALMTLNATFTVVAFSGVLWTISPLLFGVALVYASIGSFVTYLLGRRLIGLSYVQLDREADFRSDLIGLRENAESVAIVHWEDRLRDRLLHRLASLVANARRIVAVNRDVGFFTALYNYLVPIVPVFVVAHLFMRGEVEFGVITQSAMAFAQLMGAFSLIVTQFQSISSYAAVATRLGRLSNAMEAAAHRRPSPLSIGVSDGALEYDHLTLRSADGRMLVADLTLTIPLSARLLITAESEDAKAALFKATAGLWNWAEGRILRPDADGMLFLTSQPYVPKGTLRELLVRPQPDRAEGDAGIHAVLRALAIEAVISRAGGADMKQDWSEVLSPNDRCLLVVARAILARPQLVFLDDLTSALGKAAAARAFHALSEAGIGCISLGSPGADTAPFEAVLAISQDGCWKYETLRTPDAVDPR